MLEKLQKIYENMTGRTDVILKPSMKIDKSIGLTSLAKIQMVCEIEDAFGIDVPNKVLRSFKTVGDVVEYLEGLGL